VRAQGLDGWPDDRVPRTVRFRITHTESALELCRQGHAVAYVPDFVARLHNAVSAPDHQLVQVPSPAGLEQHRQGIYVVTRTGDRPHGLAAVERALHAATAG
jgi:DNA-binding transcriptional LysR family regulator